jgi:hypothetical protein
MRTTWTAVAAAVLLVAACDNPAEIEQTVYEVEVAGGERFRISLTTAAQIERADELRCNVHGDESSTSSP